MQIPKLTCFDVGARNGLSDLKSLAKNISLYSFEPSIHPNDKLRTASVQDYASFNLIDKGLYRSSGSYDFNIMANPSMSSMLEPNEPVLNEYFSGIRDFRKWRKQLKIVDRKKIETTTIDNLVEQYGLETIDYLKIDTQGTELEILAGATNTLALRKICVIKTEFAFVPFYKGQSTFTEIDLFLKSHGYKLVTCEFHYDTVSPFLKNSEKPKWGLGGDAFYSLDFDKNDDRETMLRTAIILGGLGFISNAAQLFNSLNITKSEQENFFKQTRISDSKEFLKYLLPPVLIHLFKKLFGRS